MAGILINNQSIKQSIAHNLSGLCLLSVSAIQHWFFYRAILHSPYECRYSNICVTVYNIKSIWLHDKLEDTKGGNNIP